MAGEKKNIQTNPFKAGTAHRPPLLAGRAGETKLLAEALDLLEGETQKDGTLVSDPFRPIKIVGPRGVGKTTLLNWTKREAAQRKIRFVTCERLKQNGGQSSMRKLVKKIAGDLKNALRLIKGFGVNVAGKVGASVELHQVEDFFTDVTQAVVQKQPLLLLLDEVHHYDLDMLAVILQGSQKLIGEGYPLGLVLAGTPGLDSHLSKAESTFIVRSKNIYINRLSDEAAREALLKPFGTAKIKPAALKKMTAMADNYPFFIQVVGREVWNAMVQAGGKEVDAKLVKQIEEDVLDEKIDIYTEAYDRIVGSDLLPQARQAMKILESNGGEMDKHALIRALAKANRGMKDSQAKDIFVSLSEDGFLWTVRDRTTPGIPSFFSYFKAKQREEGKR